MNDLAFGLQITLWGMGLVFGLLALLWALLSLVGWLETRGAARAPAARPPARAAEADDEALMAALLAGPAGDAPPAVHIHGAGAGALPPEAVAAITAAVLAHSANRRRQAAPETRSYWPGSLLFASRWVVAGRTRQNRGYRRERS